MSVSIYFKQFNKEKVDQAWNGIISGKFEQEQTAELAVLEKQLPELEQKIPKYTGEELDFMLYGKDPKLEVYSKAAREYETVKEKAREIDRALSRLQDLKSALDTKNKSAIIDAIIMVDSGFIYQYSGQSFAEYYHGEFDEYTQLLFSETLHIDLRKQDYYKQDGLSGIPFQVWVDAFKQIDATTMQGIKNQLDKDEEFTFENFRDCMLPIKDMVKYCLDTNTEMVVSFENEYSRFQVERAEQIYGRLV